MSDLQIMFFQRNKFGLNCCRHQYDIRRVLQNNSKIRFHQYCWCFRGSIPISVLHLSIDYLSQHDHQNSISQETKKNALTCGVSDFFFIQNKKGQDLLFICPSFYVKKLKKYRYDFTFHYSEIPRSLKFFKFSFHPARNFSCNKQKSPPCSFIDLLSK